MPDWSLPLRLLKKKSVKSKSLRGGFLGLVIAAAVLLGLHFTGIYEMNILNLSNLVGVLLIVVPIIYFGFLFARGGFDKAEKNRIIAIIMFYIAAALFGPLSNRLVLH
ncbi:MAG: hypothetical protein IPP15_09605 [Saprospiraceae bacterium]|uniref:Uncharacterized protein n=1 Tax=Candidatus Opimibacter skivensis TaxID=2982028 RepID=A0A9D7XTF5_9BACT|nr:hypothetical protein [Candidatus Opimibacter skivensis]